jgi:hypothetical protein
MVVEIAPSAKWGRPADVSLVRTAWEKIAQEVLDRKAWRVAHSGVCWTGIARDLYRRFEFVSWREALTRLLGADDPIVDELLILLTAAQPKRAGERLEEHLGVVLG